MTTEAPIASTSWPRARPLYWSVRRELWENRSVYIVPVLVAGLVVVSATASALSKLLGLTPRLSEAGVAEAVAASVGLSPAPIMLASFAIGYFYSLEALYGERRARSVLFWKSLPLSDRTAVLAKFAVPMLVLPAIAFVLSVVVVILMLVASSLASLSLGQSPSLLWARVDLASRLVVMAYGLCVHALWFAPIYAWLMLASAWARRLPILWAVVPFFLCGVLERLVFGTTTIAALVRDRFVGATVLGFQFDTANGAIDRLSQLTPLELLTSPGLPLGLLAAALILLLAMRIRRTRELN